MIPTALSFIDIETTGTSTRLDRVIEIGIIRVENMEIVKQFSSLINPNKSFDPFITKLTGITMQELKSAPPFYEIKNNILETITDSIFVAHNVMFDYGFIKHEFRRLDSTFSMKYLCSVKLSRLLYPSFRRHNLDALIERFHLSCERRHRALDDAKVIWNFYKHSYDLLGVEKVQQAMKEVMKRPSVPSAISESIIDNLPESHGVYLFYNQEGAPIYIGKSKNIRNRVLSHFSNGKNAMIDLKITQDIKNIETIITAGELGALLLESTLIKQHKPLLNRQLRHAQKLIALKKVESPGKYNSVSIEAIQALSIDDIESVLGIFKSQKQLKNFLSAVAKEYQLCPKLLGLEKTDHSCFSYQLERCKGACLEQEHHLKYNLRFDHAFFKTKIKRWPFSGPILIREKHEKEQVFLIDKWCVLGTLSHEGDPLENIGREYAFDTDTYRILAKYLGKQYINITELPEKILMLANVESRT